MEVNQILYEENTLGSVGKFKCRPYRSLEYPCYKGVYISFTEIYHTITLPKVKEVGKIKTEKTKKQ